MRNPARRLHEIFSEWSGKYGRQASAYTARGLESKSDEAYALQVEAFRLVIAIDEALRYLEKRQISVSIYRAQVKNWIDMVMHAPNAWTGPSDKKTGFPQVPMQHLDTLSTLLDMDRPRLEPGPERSLRDSLAATFDLLKSDESISDELRAYIHRLASEIRIALDDESVVGTFDFAEAAERLWISLHAAAGQSRGHKTKWKGAASDLFRESTAAAIGSLPTLTVAILQLTQK